MTYSEDALKERYDRSSPRWGDKMRTLGYYDGYLGFLSAPGQQVDHPVDVVDAGAGTAACAEAWVAVNGAPRSLTLIEPSAKMMAQGVSALDRRGVRPREMIGRIEDAAVTADEVLAAHVIEHFDDPLDALQALRGLLRPGGRLRLVVSKPHWCNAIIWLQWRHRTFGAAEIKGLLQQAGFEPEFTYAFPSGPPSRTSRGIVARRVN